jgi:translation initiation factor IF-1
MLDDEREPPGEELEAEVIELLPQLQFRLLLINGLLNQQEVIAHTAGAQQTNFVRLRPGDKVLVKISPHDRKRGRITKLLRKP